MSGILHVAIAKNSRKLPTSTALAASCVALLISIAPNSLTAQVSLSTIVDQAQRNSSTVKLATADLRKAEAVLAETQDAYIPNLVIGSAIGPPSIGFPVGQPSIASATMQSLTFSYPQRQYSAAARVGVQAASLSLKDAREQVALDASTAYIELDTIRREQADALDQAEFSSRLVQIEEQRTEAGVDPRSELLQAQLTAAQLKLKILHLDSRAATLVGQLAALTGLPPASIVPDHASIPEIPKIRGDQVTAVTLGIESAQAQAKSKQFQARGDEEAAKIRPQIAFAAQYSRDATSLNNLKTYYKFVKADNFSAGFSILIPIFDLSKRAKYRETAAEALRATAEAEQAQRQNDIQVATLTGSLRELDTLAEIASLKHEIAGEQLKAVEAQLQLGNGSGVEPGAPPQLSPKAEQQAHIDLSQKAIDALDAGFDLSKARLSLLRALGHIEDWLEEVHATEPTSASK